MDSLNDLVESLMKIHVPHTVDFCDGGDGELKDFIVEVKIPFDERNSGVGPVMLILSYDVLSEKFVDRWIAPLQYPNSGA